MSKINGATQIKPGSITAEQLAPDVLVPGQTPLSPVQLTQKTFTRRSTGGNLEVRIDNNVIFVVVSINGVQTTEFSKVGNSPTIISLEEGLTADGDEVTITYLTDSAAPKLVELHDGDSAALSTGQNATITVPAGKNLEVTLTASQK